MKELKTLFGNQTMSYILLSLERRDQVCASELARGLAIPINMIQRQLARLERGGIVESRFSGKRKIYRWNTNFYLLKPLKLLLQQAPFQEQRDPADGTHLTYEERLALAESLWREGLRLNPGSRKQLGFAKSFDTFRSGHRFSDGRKEKKVA